jgi:sugar phosphate permease
MAATVHERIFYGYYVVFAAALMSVATEVSHTSGLAFFVEDILKDLDIRRTTFTLIFAAVTFASACCTPIAGHFVDISGERIVATVACCAFIGAGFGVAMSSSPISFGISLWFLRFSGSEVMCLCSSSVVNRWFYAHRGRAFALKGFIENIRLLIPPAVTTALALTGSWRKTMQLNSCACAVVCAVSLLLMQDDPAKCGTVPDGLVTETAQTKAPPQGAKKEKKKQGFTFQQALRTQALQVIILSNIVVNLMDPALNVHAADIFAQRGVSMLTLAGCMSLEHIFRAASEICFGLVSVWSAALIYYHIVIVLVKRDLLHQVIDRLFPNKIMACACAQLGVALYTFVLLNVDGSTSATLFFALRGLVIGGRLATRSVTNAELFGQQALGKISAGSTFSALVCSQYLHCI